MNDPGQAMHFNQAAFDIRCEWGENGVARLAPVSDVVIIVDVLSFSTCVEIATARGALVFPYRWRDASAAEFARSIGAELASTQRGGGRYSLSPTSLVSVAQNTRLVLPSPNGASLTLKTGTTPTLAGCLRNCRAVAQAAMQYGRRIAVIPAGERWPDGSLRPAVEDLIGAGAIISHLHEAYSPEAHTALASYQSASRALGDMLKHCGSGRELIARGFEDDVRLAAELDVSGCVPVCVQGAYVRRGCA
ncbi:MAG TPA: 2-phosphosulfolactate phosphatase [Candidatus Tectomicrobia bacterium]|nr:2-phosphosulfolactate phosphatase [Candidatus Tectomicrobia bacterium]